MFRPLRHALDQVVTTGYLRLIDAKGCAFAFGDLSGAPVVARIADARTERRLFFNPALALGEAYMDGRIVIERGDVMQFVQLVQSNRPYCSGIELPVAVASRRPFLSAMEWCRRGKTCHRVRRHRRG